jgi:hypothetical protein
MSGFSSRCMKRRQGLLGFMAAVLRLCESVDLLTWILRSLQLWSQAVASFQGCAMQPSSKCREAEKPTSVHRLLVMMIRQTRDLSGSSQLGKSLFFLRLLRTSATDLCMSNSGDTFEALAGQKVLPSACSAEFRTTY